MGDISKGVANTLLAAKNIHIQKTVLETISPLRAVASKLSYCTISLFSLKKKTQH
jgi:hypothetical protein